jgi:hypothetical protein
LCEEAQQAAALELALWLAMRLAALELAQGCRTKEMQRLGFLFWFRPEVWQLIEDAST